jgi:hypothetical protein
MNKYLEKLASVLDHDEHGNPKIHPEGSELARRADKAKLINKPKNKLLKKVLIGGAVAKAGITGGLLYAAHKKHQEAKADHIKQANTFKTSTGEPGASINANNKIEAAQTATAVGLGMAGTKAYEHFAPRVAAKFGKAGRIAALAGSTLAADYATVKANNALNTKMSNE